jgi:hypothetical protein
MTSPRRTCLSSGIDRTQDGDTAEHPTRTDRGVPFAHAVVCQAIRHAELVNSHAHSHFAWLGPDWPAIAERIQAFLDADPPPSSDQSRPGPDSAPLLTDVSIP